MFEEDGPELYGVSRSCKVTLVEEEAHFVPSNRKYNSLVCITPFHGFAAS